MVTGILDPHFENCSGLETILCMNPSESSEKLVECLLDMECKVYVAKSPADALAKLQLRFFYIVVLEENYSLEIMQFLAFLPMSIRREMFYVLVGESFETDNMMHSFVLSANLTVNVGEIASFPELLTEGLADNNRFFRSLYYSLENLGRDVSLDDRR